MSSPEELFKATKAGKLPALVLLRGDNPYLTREWKKLIKAAGFELQERELKKTGPDAACEDLACGMSLFQTKQIVWLRAVSFPTAWSSEAIAVWKRLSAQADGEGLIVVLQAESDKRIKWENSGFRDIVDLKVEPAAAGPWLKRMNETRGAPLDGDRLRFLSGLEADLMTLDNWVELWLSGGDLWAGRSLGFVAGANTQGPGSSTNPVFGWVDAVLAGRKRESSRLLRKILDEGEEPLQLIALLAKSVRILALLESGRPIKGQPDFLVQKLQRLKGGLKPGFAKRLLSTTAEVDRLMKSSPAKASALMMRL